MQGISRFVSVMRLLFFAVVSAGESVTWLSLIESRINPAVTDEMFVFHVLPVAWLTEWARLCLNAAFR